MLALSEVSPKVLLTQGSGRAALKPKRLCEWRPVNMKWHMQTQMRAPRLYLVSKLWSEVLCGTRPRLASTSRWMHGLGFLPKQGSPPAWTYM